MQTFCMLFILVQEKCILACEQTVGEEGQSVRQREQGRALPGCSTVKLQAWDDKACMFTLTLNRILPVNYSTTVVFINTAVIF